MSCGIKQFPSVLDENLSEYPQQTSIHGVKYLVNQSRPIDRTFWIIIFIVSISLLGYFVYKLGRTWQANEITIRDRNYPTQVYEIPFPAITICPQIKVTVDKFDLSKLHEYRKPFDKFMDFARSDYGMKFIMATQICRKEFRDNIPLDIIPYSLIFASNEFVDAMQEISPSLEDIFLSCQLVDYIGDYRYPTRQDKKDCDQLFSMIITKEGVCFTFNTIQDVLRMDWLQTDFKYHNITRSRDGWDPEKGYTKGDAYPYKGIVKGTPYATGGLKFVLNANWSDIMPYCSPANLGYKIALHSPTEYPQMYDNFITLEFGKDYQIAAVPKTIETSKDLRSLAPEVRRCYFNDERKLKFYTFYNEQNCRLECYANYSKAIYLGVPFPLPREPNTTMMVFKSDIGWQFPEFTTLVHNHFKEFGTPSTAELFYSFITECHCLPECNSIHYGHKIMKAIDGYSVKLSNNGSIVEDDNGLIQTTIEIIFNNANFTGQKRIRRYPFETMLSDFGGLLGLFMGGSILSIIEMFYFVAIRNWFKSNAV